MTDSLVTDNLTGAIETEQDAGKGRVGKAERWGMELALADKREKQWRERASDVYDRYRAESTQEGSVSHNILYSNVETMRPALYDSTPVPDIRRRFRDHDPVGKQLGEVLERTVSHQMDQNDFDSVMQKCILDYLLPGRAVARVRYLPTFRTVPEQRIPFEPAIFDAITGQPEVPESAVVDENGQIFLVQPEREVLVDEEVSIEYVQWRNFRMSPAKTWDEVKWISFDFWVTKEQAKRMFGRKGAELPLIAQLKETAGDDRSDQQKAQTPNVFKRGLVREIWDKDARKVRFYSPGLKDFLLEIDDPLQLQEFWPIPRPMYAVESTDTMIPVPEFSQYESQAVELDRITKRIKKLIQALRYRGVYDQTVQEANRLMTLEDNEFIPTESATLFLEKGGLDKAFWIMPIKEVAEVLANLYVQRDQIKDTIFEITGLSDILRGVSDAQETATAQNIKSQFGSLRINRRQREVQRFARDLIRLMSEIIAEHFQPETMQRISQRQVTPDMWQILQSDQLRSYRVDIETDSTVANQMQADEAESGKLLESIGRFVQVIGPVVMQGFMPPKVAVAIMQAIVRRHKFGRVVEEAFAELEDMMNQEGGMVQQGPSPEQEQAKADMQIRMQEMEAQLKLKAAELQQKQIESQSKQDIEVSKLELEREKEAAKLQLERENAEAERQLKLAIEQAKLDDNQMNRDQANQPQVDFADSINQIAEAVDAMKDENTQTLAAAIQALSQTAEAMTRAVKQMNGKKRIVRDERGRVVGSESVMEDEDES